MNKGNGSMVYTARVGIHKVDSLFPVFHMLQKATQLLHCIKYTDSNLIIAIEYYIQTLSAIEYKKL